MTGSGGTDTELAGNGATAEQRSCVVIGGGPAGLAAAVAAADTGLDDVLILDREPQLGGILNQCIHDGFGLEVYGESLTGPEFMERAIALVRARSIDVRSGAMVIGLAAAESGPAGPDRRLDRWPDHRLCYSSPDGVGVVEAKTVILAMGCRERTRGAITIPGTRPAGVDTAGVAQHFINLRNRMVGRRVVILGSGDIGLIMARRFTLEGARVEAVLELLPYCSGLTRNRVQCLDDYGIPLYCGQTVIDIHGRDRVEAVTAAAVDARYRPIPGTERRIECDTLLLSVGLIPENELTRDAGIAIDARTGGPIVDQECQTMAPGIFACGNVLHVHDTVDSVVLEAARAGRGAARYCRPHVAVSGSQVAAERTEVRLAPGANIGYVIPQLVRFEITGTPSSAGVDGGCDETGATTTVPCSLRVCAPMGRVTLRAGAAPDQPPLATRKLRHALPAEMIVWLLELEWPATRDTLATGEGPSITITAEPLAASDREGDP